MKFATTTLLVLCFLAELSFAQVTFQPRKLSNNNRGIIYNQEIATDLRLQTNGWSVGMNWGKLKTYYLTRFYYADFGERKHLREIMFNPGIGQDRYIYGKQNNLFVLRAGIGEKRFLTEKAAKKGVAVGFSYRAGPALGLLKPYYLDVSTEAQGANATRSIKFEDNELLFLNESRIRSNSGFLVGWGEVSPALGVQAMGSLHISWGAFEEYVRAIEAGIMVDFFFREIPILVETANSPAFQNKPLFLNIFLNFQFGKRK
ncbi:MAG: hypothetical protein AAF847_04860 [Bacteroidota bacterium]